jgi:hypothetical protein
MCGTAFELFFDDVVARSDSFEAVPAVAMVGAATRTRAAAPHRAPRMSFIQLLQQWNGMIAGKQRYAPL